MIIFKKDDENYTNVRWCLPMWAIWQEDLDDEGEPTGTRSFCPQFLAITEFHYYRCKWKNNDQGWHLTLMLFGFGASITHYKN